MIGDPSGKSEERNLLNPNIVRENVAAIRQQLRPFFTSEGKNAARVLNNADWISKFSYLDWLREVGKYFSVKDMLEKQSVRRRLESAHSISYTEFSYMLMQAYDFLHLADVQNCLVQVGGDDQWGNITMGVDLVRKLRGREVFGLTFPLLTSATGQKFGKTARGTQVWLDPSMTTPFRFYQYFFNTDDKDVGRFLRLFTFLTREEIEDLEETTKCTPAQRRAQKALARAATAIVHGQAQADAAARASEVLFCEEVRSLPERLFEDIFSDAHTITLSARPLADGIPLVAAISKTALAKSNNEIRRLLRQRALYLNNKPISNPDHTISGRDLIHGKFLLIRRGKRKLCLIRFR